MRRTSGALAVALVLAVGGCTAGSAAGPASPAPSTITETIQRSATQTPAGNFSPAPATSVAPVPAGGQAPRGEIEKPCPYIKAGLDSEPTTGPNVADIEGDRVGVVTVLPGYHPVGCRFYFSYSYGDTQHEAVADILPRTFATAAAARTALIGTARAGRNAQTYRDFVPGVDGINYQTRFFGPDGDRDWAFAFAKGRVLVVVHTQQNDSPLNALYLARAVAAKF